MSSTTPCYLELTEYQPLLLPSAQLSEAMGEAIWRRYARQVAIEFPSVKTNHHWKLTAQGFVGVLPVDERLTLLLTPKTPIAKLWQLVEYVMPLASLALSEMLATVATVPELYEVLALVLAQRTLQRAQRGFAHAYAPQADRPPAVRGHLDLAESLRRPWLSTLHCRYETHTVDIAENQILLWTLERILRSAVCSERTRPTVKRAFAALAGQVTLQAWPATALHTVTYHRLNCDYRPLHALCRFFLEQCSPDLHPGDAGVTPFGLDMALLYERFVAAWLSRNVAPHWRVASQERHRLGAADDLAFTVDVVVRERSSAGARWVLDTKYKTPAAAPSTGDLAQILAYAQTTGAPEAVLIYPTPLPRPLNLTVGGVRVRSLSFDLARDIDAAGHDLLAALVSG